MLKQSIKTSLIDENIKSNQDLQHKILVNKKDDKIYTHIVNYLRNCEEFKIVVAFITSSGVSILKTVLLELEKRGIKGEILTGDYQNFTEPQALEQLNKLTNIKVRMLEDQRLHMKGYYFKQDRSWDIVVGSSNLTSSALTINQELNIKLTSTEDGKIIKDMLANFNELWKEAAVYTDFIKKYKQIYNLEQQTKEEHKKEMDKIKSMPESFIKVNPNQMQLQALNGIQEIRNKGENKALIVAATGTGKTFLAAFDVKKVQPKKLLFVIHREKIAKDACETFKSIIKDKTFGMYTGSKKEDAEYVFATIQTLYNDLSKFKEEDFDYIIIDEVHHGGAKTYQKVINYFKPKFLLGLTATPERSDDFNIFKMFNHNIAYEIRLKEAYEYNLLAPFHYFGVEEIIVEDEMLKANESIKLLTSEQRVKHIISKTKYYGHSLEKVKGLMFASTQQEASILSEQLNKKGYKTKALTSADNENTREKAIKELEEGQLSYLITVDIFNEGIDIPCVNQIVMLRPTKSAIVYIQQLGRGLRKYSNKNYVVIIDFIGNYNTNFLIPIALSGNNTADKDQLKRFLNNGSNEIMGEVVINIEKVPYQQIIDNITKYNFSRKSNFKLDYINLKNKLGKIPSLNEFKINNYMSPNIILETFDTYIDALMYVKEDIEQITKAENNILKFVSKELYNVKRLYEILIIELIMEEEKNFEEIKEHVLNFLGECDEVILNNAIKHLTKEIFENMYKNYDEVIKLEDMKYSLNAKVKSRIFLEQLKAIVDLKKEEAKGLNNYLPSNKLIYLQKYTRPEVNHVLNQNYIRGGINLKGYIFHEEIKTVLMFITFDDSGYFTDYDNQLISANQLTWFSQENKTLYKNGKKTKEKLIEEGYYKTYIFIRRTAGDSFYSVGEVEETLSCEEIQKGEKTVIKYLFKLKNILPDQMYKYLKGER